VVFVSRLPPPRGGICTWTRIVFERGLPGGWSPRLVDTDLPANRQTFVRGRVSGTELRRTARILLHLLRELALRRPAIVHFNLDPLNLGVYRDFVGAVVARLFGVPVVLHHHGLVARLEEQPERRLQRWILTRAARVASVNIALNEPSAAFLRERTRGSRARVVSLPNFFDETALPPDTGEAEGPPRVAFVAGLTLAKGAHLAVEVARRLPHIELHLFGDVYDEIRPALDAAPANVFVHGEIEHDALIGELRASRLLLLPSEHEGFPYAVLEAMALGLPVVAAPVGAIPEMIEEGRGGLLRPREPGALAAAVGELLADEPRRARMGRFNREKAWRLYAYASVSRALAGLYESLAGGDPRA